MPQLLVQFPQMIATMESTRTMMLTMHSTMSGIFAQMEEASDNATAMGKDFDAAKNDDSFYLPPEVFKNEDFQRVMKIFLSPDGKAARMLISQRGDPATPEGISRVDPIKTAAEEALKGTPLENAKIYLAGTAATSKDLVEGSKYDLLIAGVAALCLIFIIMLIMTRSFVAALVIVGTVALSLGASFGLSVLVWQHILGIQMHWVVLAMSVIILLAVGSDYNLLLVSRMKEEIGAGHKHGHHPGDGRHRQGRDGRGSGVRVHHGVDGGQRPAQHRSGGHHHRAGSVVRHVGRACVHDAFDRRAAGALVLVAATRAPPPRQCTASAGRAPSAGPFPVAEGLANGRMSTERPRPPFIARTIRRFSLLIILAWLVLILISTLASVGWNWAAAIPSLERVGEEHSVSLMPKDAPSVQAMTHMGKVFKESDSDSFAMIVLEGQQPLGDDAHQYYAGLVRELRNDPKHVEHVQDLWGDRLTASSVQSPDGKAAYVQLNLAGNQGTTLGDESVAAVRNIVDRTPPPPGVKAYVTGAGTARFGYATQWQQIHSEDHRGNRRDHLHDAPPRVPFDRHRDSAVGHGWRRISGSPGNRRVSRP